MGPAFRMNEMAVQLQKLLADIHHLYVKTLACHWNVEDARFHQLHLLFQQQYEELAGNLDEVAERVRQMGVKCPRSASELQSARRLADNPAPDHADAMLEALAEDYEYLVLWTREDIALGEGFGDPATVDLLTQLLRQFEKACWFLKSHLSASYRATMH